MSKWVTLGDANLYSIHFHAYENMPGREGEIVFAAEAHFYSSTYESDDVRMDVTFHGLEKVDLKYVEERFAKMFKEFNCIPDPHNQ